MQKNADLKITLQKTADDIKPERRQIKVSKDPVHEKSTEQNNDIGRLQTEDDSIASTPINGDQKDTDCPSGAPRSDGGDPDQADFQDVDALNAQFEDIKELEKLNDERITSAKHQLSAAQKMIKCAQGKIEDIENTRKM